MTMRSTVSSSAFSGEGVEASEASAATTVGGRTEANEAEDIFFECMSKLLQTTSSNFLNFHRRLRHFLQKHSPPQQQQQQPAPLLSRPSSSSSSSRFHSSHHYNSSGISYNSSGSPRRGSYGIKIGVGGGQFDGEEEEGEEEGAALKASEVEGEEEEEKKAWGKEWIVLCQEESMMRLVEEYSEEYLKEVERTYEWLVMKGVSRRLPGEVERLLNTVEVGTIIHLLLFETPADLHFLLMRWWKKWETEWQALSLSSPTETGGEDASVSSSSESSVAATAEAANFRGRFSVEGEETERSDTLEEEEGRRNYVLIDETAELAKLWIARKKGQNDNSEMSLKLSSRKVKEKLERNLCRLVATLEFDAWTFFVAQIVGIQQNWSNAEEEEEEEESLESEEGREEEEEDVENQCSVSLNKRSVWSAEGRRRRRRRRGRIGGGGEDRKLMEEEVVVVEEVELLLEEMCRLFDDLRMEKSENRNFYEECGFDIYFKALRGLRKKGVAFEKIIVSRKLRRNGARDNKSSLHNQEAAHNDIQLLSEEEREILDDDEWSVFGMSLQLLKGEISVLVECYGNDAKSLKEHFICHIFWCGKNRDIPIRDHWRFFTRVLNKVESKEMITKTTSIGQRRQSSSFSELSVLSDADALLVSLWSDFPNVERLVGLLEVEGFSEALNLTFVPHMFEVLFFRGILKDMKDCGFHFVSQQLANYGQKLLNAGEVTIGWIYIKEAQRDPSTHCQVGELMKKTVCNVKNIHDLLEIEHQFDRLDLLQSSPEQRLELKLEVAKLKANELMSEIEIEDEMGGVVGGKKNLRRTRGQKKGEEGRQDGSEQFTEEEGEEGEEWDDYGDGFSFSKMMEIRRAQEESQRNYRTALLWESTKSKLFECICFALYYERLFHENRPNPLMDGHFLTTLLTRITNLHQKKQEKKLYTDGSKKERCSSFSSSSCGRSSFLPWLLVETFVDHWEAFDEIFLYPNSLRYRFFRKFGRIFPVLLECQRMVEEGRKRRKKEEVCEYQIKWLLANRFLLRPIVYLLFRMPGERKNLFAPPCLVPQLLDFCLLFLQEWTESASSSGSQFAAALLVSSEDLQKFMGTLHRLEIAPPEVDQVGLRKKWNKTKKQEVALALMKSRTVVLPQRQLDGTQMLSIAQRSEMF